SARRTELSEHIEQLPNVTPEQHEALMNIFDTGARQWAKEHPGQDPGDYYTAADGFNLSGIRLLEHYEHGVVPEEALTQRRGVATAERFNAETHGQGLLDKYTPVKVRGQPRAKIAGLPKTIKTRANFRDLLNDMAGRLEAGLGHAKNWYRDSGREILAA